MALAGIAFADLLMFMQLGFQAALYDSNTRLDRSFKADVVLISPRALNLQNLSTSRAGACCRPSMCPAWWTPRASTSAP